jgi:hypothetical protein
MTAPRFVRYTDHDGNTMDGILLSPAETGEGTTGDLVIPLDRGSGASVPVEATAGEGPGTYAEVTP